MVITYEIILALLCGISIGFILGIIFDRIIQKTSLLPLWSGIAVITFVGVNVYSVVTGAEVPQVFNFTLALIVGTVSGIDLVKYIPALSNLGKK